MKDNQVNSIKELQAALCFFEPYRKKKQLFFRGQLTKYLSMDPTIARNEGKELKFENQYYLENESKEKTVLQNLAYMQHNGIHTRLLDFTTDPLVSLFFALNSSEREDSSIYVFIRNSMPATSIEVQLMGYLAKSNDRYIPTLVRKFNKEHHTKVTIKKAVDVFSHDLFITPSTLQDDNNKRMKEQKGTFAFPANKIKDLTIISTQPFEDDKSYQEIVIPFEFHEEIFQELKNKNYSSKRLYGDAKLDKKIESLFGGYSDYISEHFYMNQNGFYKKGKEYITCKTLLTKKEIQQIGFKIAKKRKLDMLKLWFQRQFKKDGVDITTQFWSQGRGKII